MSNERNALKVGIVTLVVLALCFATLIWISKGVGGDVRRITVRFRSTPDMPMLSQGSPVLVGGQKVGRVVETALREMDAAKQDGTRERTSFVIVEAEIQTDLKLRKDCVVSAEGPPLGGDGIVKIDLGKAAELAPAGQVIDGALPSGFGAILAAIQGELNGSDPSSLLGQIKAQLAPGDQGSLMAKLLKSMDDLNRVTGAVASQLSPQDRAGLLAKLHGVMDNVNAATGALRAEMDGKQPAVLLGKVHQAVDSVNASLADVSNLLRENGPPLTRTVQHVESTAEKIDVRIAENVAAQTDPQNLDGLMAKLNRAATQLNESLEDINAVTDTTRGVVVLNRDNVNRILGNFKETSEHLKSAVKYVLQRPWRLLHEPTLTETRQQAVYDAAREFSEAATRMEESMGQLRALAELHDGHIAGDDADLARIRGDLKGAADKFNQAEEALWKQLGVK